MTWPARVEGFHIPVYGGRIFFCRDAKAWNQCQKHMGSADTTDGKVSGLCGELINSESGEVVYLIGWFAGGGATLVHELAHVTFFILDRAGVPVEPGGDNEAYAYLLDTLYTEAISTLKL